MPNRKRGGQPGNQNAIKHGRHSAVLRAERRAAFEESQRLQRERWPDIPIGYDAIIEGLRALKEQKEALAASRGRLQ